MSNDSVHELEAKLAKYRGQLAQLDALLSSDSSNADLQKLRGDLQKAIGLTEIVLKEKQAKAAAEKAAAVPVTETNTGWSSAAPASNSVPASHTGIKLSLTGGAASEAQPTAAATKAGGRFAEGSKVEGPFPTADGRVLWFPGVVSVNHGAGTATVRFIGVPGGGSWADGVVMEESQLRPLPLHPAAPAPHELRPGFRVIAKYSGDGGWWPAVIDDVTGSDHIRVTFQGYGNTEIVPREYLQRAKGIAGAAEGAAGAASDAAGSARPGAASGPGGVAAGGTGATDADAAARQEAEEDAQDAKDEQAGIYAGLVIPDNLRLLPTDTAEERLRKRKKVKALKLAWKQRKQEEQTAARATSWQSFVQKAGDKRRLAAIGIAGGGGGGSIFRSGEGVASRVGVTGSGHGVTHENEDARKRLRAAPGLQGLAAMAPGSGADGT